MKYMESVPPKSLDQAFAHLEKGGRLVVPTAYRSILITHKTLLKFRAVGGYLLKEEDNGYRMQSGRSSVYILPGQLRFC